MAARPDLVSTEFRRRFQIDPAGPEALNIVLDEALSRIAPPVTERVFREKVEEYYRRASTYFRNYAIQVGYTMSPGLAIADAPVITASSKKVGLGPHQGVALMEADYIVMPISSRRLIGLGPEPGVIHLDKAAVAEMNRLQTEACLR